MKFIVLILSLFSFSNAFSIDVGLDVGSELNSINLNGSAMVYCSGTSTTSRFVSCYSSSLDAGVYSRLVVTNGTIDADSVKIVSFHEDGSKRKKSSNFDAASGLSTKRFNLWISTVLQRPLLEYGMNTIIYQFYKGSEMVLEGEFDVHVNQGDRRSCPYGTIFSTRSSDCEGGSMICDEYFRKYNYCR